jgi:hypothetical protein
MKKAEFGIILKRNRGNCETKITFIAPLALIYSSEMLHFQSILIDTQETFTVT